MSGDCVEQLHKVRASTVDLIVTDPPYNLGEFNKGRNNGIHRLRDNQGDDDWAELMDGFMEQAARVCKPKANMVVFMIYQKLIAIAQRHGFYLKVVGVWHKTNPIPRNMKIRYVDSLEYWVHFVYAARTRTFNAEEGKPQHNYYECPVVGRAACRTH